MLPGLLAALAVLIFHRRLPFPYGDLGTLVVVLAAIPWGIVTGEVFVWVLLPALIAEVVGFRVPLLHGGGGKRHAILEEAGRVSETARYTSTTLESRWPRGRLEAVGEYLRFVDEDEDEFFRVPRAQVSRISGITIGRGDLRIDTTTQGSFVLSLGKRGVGLSEAHAGARFWHAVIGRG